MYPTTIDSFTDSGIDLSKRERLIFIEGYKLAQQQMHSEEDMKSAFKTGFSIGYGSDVYAIDEKNKTCEEWFNTFKKK